MHSLYTLTRGQKLRLPDLTAATRLTVGVALQAPAGLALDISCFGVDAADKLSDDRYFIFYNQKRSPCGSLVAGGAGEGDMERFTVDLAQLPQTIRKLVFVITLDGAQDMSCLGESYFRLLDNGRELARFGFSGRDFSKEKAVIVAEIYHKDVWRFAAVGQGFNGGLSALLKHFGGEEKLEAHSSSPVPPHLPAAPAKVSLEKKLEKAAPHLISLAKPLKLSLEKRKLENEVACVALVLDASGSMTEQYQRGDVQRIVDRIFPLAVHFDDNGELDTWAFALKQMPLTPVSGKNVQDYVNREAKGWQSWMKSLNAGYNNEPVVMRDIMARYKKSRLPAYVIFISDGGVGHSDEIERLLVESSRMPIFWQFVGIGGSNYGILERFDSMRGRFIDNCNFFSLDDIRSVTEQVLYERLLGEFPQWLKEARAKNILTI